MKSMFINKSRILGFIVPMLALAQAAPAFALTCDKSGTDCTESCYINSKGQEVCKEYCRTVYTCTGLVGTHGSQSSPAARREQEEAARMSILLNDSSPWYEVDLEAE